MTQAGKNNRVALIAVLLVIGMTGLSFAAVPLYRIFCQVTGFSGTVQRASAAPTADQVNALHGKTIRVRFDGNVRGLGWRFKPVTPLMEVKIGEQNIAFYKAENLTSEDTTGSATFNVTPMQSGGYFSKIQCFCFTEQTLKAGEAMDMPVIFYIEPDILDDPEAKDINEITLSYTFFPVDKPEHSTRTG